MTDKEIGDYVSVDRALVCRWRNGERTLKKDSDAYTVKRLALFFVERAKLKSRQSLLAGILSLTETDIEVDNKTCIRVFTEFLFGGKPIDIIIENTVTPTPVKYDDGNFIGVQGVLDALIKLQKQLKKCDNVEMTVYLSLEHTCLLQDETAPEIWELLYRINRNEPVRVVFDGWTDNTERVSENLKALLPFMQMGKTELHIIKSSQKFFYHNLTFFAKGSGMVITTEPAGGLGVYISLLTESPDYVSGMGAVFASFDRLSKNLARHIGGTKDEAAYYGRLFEPTMDVQIFSSEINLLYMDEANYLSLLKLNGIKGGQRSYRHTKFIEDKQRFDAFLSEHHIREIMSLPEIDRMIDENRIRTSDFSFHMGEIKADKGIIQSLIDGLLGYVTRYKNLSVLLERGEGLQTGFTCRIKGDNFILLHAQDHGDPHTVYSDNWMLIYEYIKQFHEALQSEQLINTKSAVKTALQLRLEKLGGL